MGNPRPTNFHAVMGSDWQSDKDIAASNEVITSDNRSGPGSGSQLATQTLLVANKLLATRRAPSTRNFKDSGDFLAYIYHNTK